MVRVARYCKWVIGLHSVKVLGLAEEARAVATDLAAIYPGVQPVQALLDSL